MGLPKRKLEVVAIDDHEVTPGKMSVRDYANACVKLATIDHQEASMRAKWQMDLFFFFMRRVKAHPKLMSVEPAAAAGVVQRLVEQEDDIQQLVDDCDMSLDDVVAFVLQRWTAIQSFAGMSPIEAAMETAYQENVVWIPSKVVEWFHRETDAGRDTNSREEQSRLCEDDWASKPRAVPIEPAMVVPPTFGIFTLVVFHTYKRLSQGNPNPAKVELILGTDSISELFKKRGVPISGKTIWDYRERMVRNGVLTKLPRTGLADRFRFDLRRFLIMVCSLVNQANRIRNRADSISLD